MVLLFMYYPVMSHPDCHSSCYFFTSCYFPPVSLFLTPCDSSTSRASRSVVESTPASDDKFQSVFHTCLVRAAARHFSLATAQILRVAPLKNLINLLEPIIRSERELNETRIHRAPAPYVYQPFPLPPMKTLLRTMEIISTHRTFLVYNPRRFDLTMMHSNDDSRILNR